MGLDQRDCRCDAAMILGDGGLPDNVNWKVKDRDKTCVWLDFIDAQFNPIDSSAANVTENKTIRTTVVSFEPITAPGKASTEAISASVYNDRTTADVSISKTVNSRVCSVSETSARKSNKTVTVNLPSKKTTVISIENKTVTVGED